MLNKGARRAFTLAEVVVALLLLACGGLALAAASAGAVRTVGSAEAHAFAVATATARVEQLAAGPCSELGDGTAVDTVRQVSERWVAGAEQNGARLITARLEQVDRGAVHRVVLRRLASC